MEELGELCEEVLLQEKIQRVEKLKNKKSNIDKEFADALITTLLLAENMHIDMINGLKKNQNPKICNAQSVIVMLSWCIQLNRNFVKFCSF